MVRMQRFLDGLRSEADRDVNEMLDVAPGASPGRARVSAHGGGHDPGETIGARPSGDYTTWDDQSQAQARRRFAPFADVDRGVPTPVASFGSAAVATLAPAETEVEPEPDLVVDHEPEVEAAPVPRGDAVGSDRAGHGHGSRRSPKWSRTSCRPTGTWTHPTATIAPRHARRAGHHDPGGVDRPDRPRRRRRGGTPRNQAKPQVDFWQEPTLKPKKGWRGRIPVSAVLEVIAVLLILVFILLRLS